MYNKYTAAIYAAVIAFVPVASVFAIGFVQQAVAQGNQTTGGGASGANMTSAGATTTGGCSR